MAGFDASQVFALAKSLEGAGAASEARARLVIAKSAADIESDAKQLAPVDTGYLKNSISRDVDGLRAEIGPTASYGVFLEFGTSRMPPQPYMGPALDNNLPGFEAAMESLGKAGI